MTEPKYRRISDGQILTEDEMWAVFQPMLDALTPDDIAAMDEYAEYTGGVLGEVSLEELVYESEDYEVVWDGDEGENE